MAQPDDLYARVQAARARYLQGPELPRQALAPLADRLNRAMLDLVGRWPDAFRGTELDPEATRRKMEKLVGKIEALMPPDSKEPAANLSPAEMLARQWREALAANTMGAAAARQAEDARHRAVEQEVRSAQSAWQRLGPLDPEVRKPLQDLLPAGASSNRSGDTWRACRFAGSRGSRRAAGPRGAATSGRSGEPRLDRLSRASTQLHISLAAPLLRRDSRRETRCVAASLS